MAPFFPREGIFTLDALTILLKRTLLNPTLTLPIFLALQYTPRGQALLKSLGPRGAKLFSKFKILLALGLVGRINGFLSQMSSNNWRRDKFSPSSEIVVVTGGSSGIGAAMVRELTKPGLGIKAVVVLDVQPLLYEAAKNVHFFAVDLSSSDNIGEVCKRVREEVGNPTVLINNAGVCRGKTILDSSAKDNELTFAVNTLSHFNLAREFLPAMISANHGHVVTVASIGAYMAAPQMVDYNSSKAAAHCFHEGLGLELVHRYNAPKVRTTLVSQGYVKTPLFQGFKNTNWFMLPGLETETVADAVVEKVLRHQSGHIVLPRMYNLYTGIRGWPIWYQNRVRGQTKNHMSKWNGKQVLK
ncbi:hypothetical protein BZA05DRAFT_135106 [Tricharina praecox]|uniref:uncharacterized protein n=1 Tax=Tricharina praecox TaxID=43433 RepID=UPI00221F3A86|nr:uncharacterized protein BZA05DRAFT_135106 [Tricharina praecox]KAI5846743.1 hypothetical protein BZA05DRAFT_135106 [Tricharina praecox]